MKRKFITKCFWIFIILKKKKKKKNTLKLYND